MIDQFKARAITSRMALIVLATLLSACAAPPRSAENDKGVKKVAVVSMLNERAPVVHVGMTVFNNDRTILDQKGELNLFAINVLEQRLHAARPVWEVVAVPPDEALAKKSNSGTPWVSFTASVKEDLVRIAREADADFVFAVVDVTRENSPGRGVGVWMRAISKSSVGSALVHAHVMLVLVDRNGTEIMRSTGSDGTVSASELGLNYDLSTLQDAKVQAQVSAAMRKQLGIALTEAAGHIGY